MSDEEHRRACEIRAIAAMSEPERRRFFRGATVKRCRRALGCRYVNGVLQHCDRGPGCGLMAMAELQDAVRATETGAGARSMPDSHYGRGSGNGS